MKNHEFEEYENQDFQEKKKKPIVLVDFLREQRELEEQERQEQLERSEKNSKVLFWFASIICLFSFLLVFLFYYNRNKSKEDVIPQTDPNPIVEHQDSKPEDNNIEENQDVVTFTLPDFSTMTPEEILNFLETNENLQEILGEEEYNKMMQELRLILGFYSDIFNQYGLDSNTQGE